MNTNKNFSVNKNFMSYDRNEFKNHLESKLIGAMSEFGLCTLTCRNNLKDDSQLRYHWLSEYVRLGIEEFKTEYDHSTKSNFNKRKALSEVIKYCRSTIMPKYIKYCFNKVKNELKVTKVSKPLTEKDFEHLFSVVEGMNSTYVLEREWQGLPDRGYRFFGETKPHYDDYLSP